MTHMTFYADEELRKYYCDAMTRVPAVTCFETTRDMDHPEAKIALCNYVQTDNQTETRRLWACGLGNIGNISGPYTALSVSS